MKPISSDEARQLVKKYNMDTSIFIKIKNEAKQGKTHVIVKKIESTPTKDMLILLGYEIIVMNSHEDKIWWGE